MKFIKHKTNPNSHKEQIQQYLQPTLKVADSERPAIIQWYADTYKGVDRFDQYMGYIPYQYKCYSPNLVLYLGMLRMIVTNAWMLYTTSRNDQDIDRPELSLKTFTKTISEHLIDGNK